MFGACVDSCGARRVPARNLRIFVSSFESRKFWSGGAEDGFGVGGAHTPTARGRMPSPRRGEMPPTIYESPDGCVRRRVAFHRRSRRGSALNISSIFIPPAAPIIVPRSPYPRPCRHPADLDVARIAPPDRSDAKKDRRLSSFSLFNAGFSLLKSLGKSASKRKRDANADEDLEEDDDSASKRTRGATGYAQGPGSAFITSSVRKSKGESSPSSSRYDRSATRIAPALDARGVARSASPNPKVDRRPPRRRRSFEGAGVYRRRGGA